MARILWDPSEPAYTDESIPLAGGWTSGGSYTFLTSGGPGPRKDPSGKGGLVFIQGYISFNARDALRSPAFTIPLNHYHLKLAMAIQSTGGTVCRTEMRGAGALKLRIGTINGGVFTLEDGSGTLASSSVSPANDTWFLVEVEAYQDAANGFAKVWIDGVLEIDYVGALTAGPVDQLRLNGDDDPYWDDISINSITMRYDGGAGLFTPTVGDTVTDGTTGATAIVTAIVGDSTSGVFTLEYWNEVAFGDGNVLTEDGTATTALVDAPDSSYTNGFEPNSSRMRNEYVQALYPSGVGTYSQLRSINATDGSQATETLTSTGTPSDGDTVTIGTQTYTYKTILSTGPTVPNEVLIGASQALAMENLRRAVNGDGAEGTEYGVGTSINEDVTATDTATTVAATSIYYGTSENSIVTTETGATLAWGAATLSGGTGENYQAVNDLVISTAAYNEAPTNGDQDTYLHDAGSRLDSGTSRVTAVASWAYAKTSLTGLDGVQFVLYDGASDYLSPRKGLSGVNSPVEHTWNTRPDTDVGWSTSAVIAVMSEQGIKFTL